jgi:N-acetylmuramoyl-L-alanine amidase
VSRRPLLGSIAWVLVLLAPASAGEPKPVGDEIIVCGRRIHIGAPVVTWMDPGGYDAYKTERLFPTTEKDAPATVKLGFGPRRSAGFSPELRERARTGDIDQASLQDMVDQFVIHFDACGTSRKCFEILHDRRGLAVQFMLDLDGTIYQTLDLKEGAWHATKANGRSVGVEIANVGAYASDENAPFDKWYKTLPDGRTILTVPGPADSNGIRDKSAVLAPIRPKPVTAMIQGKDRTQYDLTHHQYDSLIKLTAALHKTFPKIRLDYPRDGDGKLVRDALSKEVYDRYQGVLGHYHVQTNKCDPGPAFQFDKVIEGAKALGGGK